MTAGRFKKIIFSHISAAAGIMLYLILPIKCPVLYFLHIPCPTCGMSRSAIALLRLDFVKSFKLNPMTVPFFLLLLFGLHKNLLPVKKRTADIILVSGTVFVFIVYIIRLIFI